MSKYSLESMKYIAFNSYGGFTQDGDEYHILNTNTPLPWSNVMANKRFGTVVSSYGTVYTYFKNSQGFKLTNWCNDWISFEPGEKFEGIYDKDYNLVYGFGYTKVLQEENGIHKQMDIFIHKEDPIKIQKIRLQNDTCDEKETEITYQLDPVLGVTKETNIQYILCKEKDGILYLRNPYNREFPNCIVFLTVVGNTENTSIEFDPDTYSVKIKTKLIGNSVENYAILFGAYEIGVDEVNYIEKIKEKYKTIEQVDKEYELTKTYWKEMVKNQYSLESPYIEIMANGWLLYQTIVCRIFARTAFYQCGGAFGYRDQLQDSLALIDHHPEMTRDQIIMNASKQFEKGDVLHWWHEHNNSGIRTYFSDDYLWLPYVLSEYIAKTQDEEILDVKTKFLEDKPMGNEREVYALYHTIDKEASIYEHAKLAINYGLSRRSKENGLLEIGDGDWNDGFSNIRGESVWLTFFMMDVLKRFVQIANIKKDEEMAKKCEKYRHILKHSVIDYAWNVDHFVRAFFENGEVLGAYSNKECKIDLISQAWAVIALKEYPDLKPELEMALKAVEKYLVDKDNMLVRLLYPAFDHPKLNPGYIKAYVPGIRENGGQYTHAAIWLAKAYFELRQDEKGIEILKFVNPIYHSDTKEKADKYMVEPYVVAADIYSNAEHAGRGGWTWYTGSSGWMYKVIRDYLIDR